MNDLTAVILAIVRERQRCTPSTRGVLPRTVGMFMDEYKAEQTLRRYMRTLWQQGVLERCGGANSRRGYKVAVQPVQVMRTPLRVEIRVQVRVAV
jgi:hypothetical protein